MCPLPPHRCSVCNASFFRPGDLSSHMTAMHDDKAGPEPYKCDVCDRTFAKLDALVRHMSIHRGTIR